MRRLSWTLAILLAPVIVFGRAASAEDPKPEVKAPTIATDEEAAAALEKFKEEWKAKGLKGDDRISQRDFAMGNLAKVQHKDVVEALARVTSDPDATLRTLAVIYLGEQKACPGSSGAKVAGALKKNADDTVLVMSALQSVGTLKYLGAGDAVKGYLKDQDFALKKSAIAAVGATGDMRLIDDLLLVAGIVVNTDHDGKGAPTEPEKKDGKETTDGYSWEGADASVDTGSSGDSDQKAAEAAAKAKMAANKAAADAAHKTSGGTGSSGGGSAGGEGATGGRGAAGRTTQELIPFVRDALKKLTGEQFHGAGEIKAWISEHRDEIAAKKKALDDEEHRQAADAAHK